MGQEPATRPEVVFGVCMSTDVQGYSTLSEQVPEDELATLTTRYFEQLSVCVEKHGGEVLEVRGDGMIAVWSAPEENSTSSLQATRAALEILQAVRRLNSEDRSRQLPTRVGLHAGRVALGNIGGGGHLAFSVVGDSMNTAARIQELNKALGTRLLASSVVVRNLEGWLCRRVGQFQPRGQEKVLSIFEVIGPHASVIRGEMELSERFGNASELFKQGSWEEAAQVFAEILKSYPGDGPSRFYLERCRAFIESPPPSGQEMIISV
jgi:adenylate cyclase